jgi:hypothetical protein
MPAPYCNWPSCLTEAQAAQLVAEIEYEERTGEPYPDPDLTDYRTICGCREPPLRAAGYEPPL